MKIRLSLAALAALSTMSFAAGIELYEDVNTKQIFTEPGENRQKLGSFVQENNLAEMMSKEIKSTPISSKAGKIELSGTHYLGYTMNQYGATNSGDKTSAQGGVELRRNYITAKAYLDGKDYFRVTLDDASELGNTPADQGGGATSTTTTGSATNGYANIFIKYAYLWLDNVLPYTGVEMGITHRAWIDYEENNAWYYRSLNRVLLEDKFSVATKSFATKFDTINVGPDVMNSADFGVNFRTHTPYFSSEIALFNGEGYHPTYVQGDNKGMSFEGRLTANLMGDGEHEGHRSKLKDTYADISVSWMDSMDHKDYDQTITGSTAYDRKAYWLHAVYNIPEFLIAAQVGKMTDDYHKTAADKEKNMYSVNAEVRPMKDWTILARYDNLDQKLKGGVSDTAHAGDANQYIIGLAYKYNKYVNFIGSYKSVDAKETTAGTGSNGANVGSTVGDALDKKSYMLTAEINW